MPDRVLRNLLGVIVAWLLVWPLPHYFLTQQIGSDPWKNFGLAMYATYFDIGVIVAYRRPGRPWVELREDDVTGKLISHFIELRQTRGLLLEPDSLAEELGKLTRAEEMRIVVGALTLDGRTGVMRRVYRQVFEYDFSKPRDSQLGDAK